MKPNYRKTILCCFTAYVVQAVVNNFVPLLFVTFQRTYQIPLAQITLLVTFNFGIQLLVDLGSVAFVDRLGYRTSMLLAHILAALGLIMLTVLPEILPNPFLGILLSVVVYAIGGGLLEVLVSPVMESCPAENKEKAMSMLHSFYCWGHMGVVLISTAFFRIFGINSWKVLALCWAAIPIANAFAFSKAPMVSPAASDNPGSSLKQLFQTPRFWLFLLMMLCAGASEQAVSQWASAFAEKGLGISKTSGDLAGPMFFAFMMGSSRAFYGKMGDRISLNRFMIVSALLCIAAYLGASLLPIPWMSLLCCGLVGLSVGIFWPGTFSKAAAGIPGGGTAMFALLALAGDLGCASGPTLAGFVSDLSGGNLRLGILSAVVFPVMILVCIGFLAKTSPES